MIYSEREREREREVGEREREKERKVSSGNQAFFLDLRYMMDYVT